MVGPLLRRWRRDWPRASRWGAAPCALMACLYMVCLPEAVWPSSGDRAGRVLSLSSVRSLPGEDISLALSIVGQAAPEIAALTVGLVYTAPWLHFLDARPGSAAAAGTIVVANGTEAEDGLLVRLSLAVTEPAPVEGELVELQFHVAEDAPVDGWTYLDFTPETRVNRGLPTLAVVPGVVTVCGTPQSCVNPADFTGDGAVDMDDVYTFADHFGAARGDPGFHPMYDLDGDARIGFDDFFLLADRYNELP